MFFVVTSCTKKGNVIKTEYKVLLDSIESSYKKSDIDKTKIYLKKYLFKAVENKNNFYKGKAFFRLGVYYGEFRQIDSSYYFYKQSVISFKSINDSIRVARSLCNIAILESDYYNDYLSSSLSGVSALKYIKGEKTKFLSGIYNCLAVNERRLNRARGAIKYYDKAIKFSSNINKYTYYNNKANIYKDLKEYSKSIEILKTLLIDSILETQPKTKARIIDNLAYTKWLKDPEENVLTQLIEAKLIRDEKKDSNGLIASYAHLSDYYNSINLNKSLEFAYKMYVASKQEKNSNDVIEALDKIIKQEKPEKAIQYAKERIRINDSLQSAKDKAQYKYALVKYESEENEKEAIESKLLAEQQKSQKQLWVFIGLTTFLGFIVYFFYKRNKTKKEKIIEVYKTETRLAKKIHDELANDVYLAMNKIQKENREDTSVLCDLEKIYSLTRNISHENSPVVTGEQFEDFLKQLFLEFSIDTCRVMSKGLSEVQINILAKEKQIVMYRVLQELLVNMKKHSKANLVVISFSALKGAIQVRYKDNGIGIDNLSLKNGLQNMETRIKSIGGTIIFESEIQKGFQAKFQLKK